MHNVKPSIGVRVKLATKRQRPLGTAPAACAANSACSSPKCSRPWNISARTQHGRLPQPAALSPGQPDQQHPQRSKTALNRSGPRLCRTAAARRGHGIHRRRRRPGRRLRRLADQFRISHQLLASRNTPTTSSSTSRKSATRRASKHPTIISESGRAMVAYHSVLVFNVLGCERLRPASMCPSRSPKAERQANARSRWRICSTPTAT